MRLLMVMAALSLSACGRPGDGNGGATPDRKPASRQAASLPTVTPILRTARTIAGQPLKLPPGKSEMVAVAVDIPAGGALPIHQHPWSRFFYVERGTLRVVNESTHKSTDFTAGQVLPEAVAQWHHGEAAGDGPVRLIVIDLVPPGVNNTVMKPAAAAP
jgi:quercetin dioxygenase-like cupin family protein